MVAVLVVADDEGAALVVVVGALVVLLVVVDALVVDDAEVSAVVELVVEPQAAIAASAAAAAKLKIKRMGSPPPGKWDEEPSALNLSAALAQSDNFESVPKCLVKTAFRREPQHSTTFTANPPWLVSLYLDDMSKPVWRMVSIT